MYHTQNHQRYSRNDCTKVCALQTKLILRIVHLVFRLQQSTAIEAKVQKLYWFSLHCGKEVGGHFAWTMRLWVKLKQNANYTLNLWGFSMFYLKAKILFSSIKFNKRFLFSSKTFKSLFFVLKICKKLFSIIYGQKLKDEISIYIFKKNLRTKCENFQ